MKKKILTLVLLLVAAISGAQAQVLYKISGKNLEQPSYIVGSYHLAPISFVDSIKGIRSAMQETAQVCGELDMQDVMKPENMQKMQAAMMLPEGQTLKTIFTADELAKVNALLKNVMGVDMSNPMVEQQLGKLTPQALTTQLSLLVCMKKHPGFNPQEQFDSYFQQQAIKAQKPVIGFETVDFQIKTLLCGMSLDRQKQLLVCMADNLEKSEANTERMLQAYFAQNLAELKTLMEEKENTACDSTPEEETALIYGRNADWLTKMPEIMANAPTLFVVGAGHLPGDRGVLKLLQVAGYTVEGVR